VPEDSRRGTRSEYTHLVDALLHLGLCEDAPADASHEGEQGNPKGNRTHAQ